MLLRTARTCEKEDAFLDGLAEGLSAEAAARNAGIGRRTAYDWRSADPDFAARWQEAYDAGTAALKDEARRRAVDGVEEPVFYQGQLVGHVRKYSDILLMFLLKQRDVSFRESARVTVTGELTFSQALAQLSLDESRVIEGSSEPTDEGG